MSRTMLRTTLFAMLALFLVGQASGQESKPRTRRFMFRYAASITGLKPGQVARIWLPIPPDNSDQHVQIVSTRFPIKAQNTRDKKYGNQMFYLKAKANDEGLVRLAVAYKIRRKEVSGTGADAVKLAPKMFLMANKLVPIGGKPASLLRGKKIPKDQLALGKTLFDVVRRHMTYDKSGKGWGRGDASWACDSKTGNCTDFHSLFISLARSQAIPAKFHIGFAVPEKRGQGKISGYHCWASFKPDGRGWIPVDIAQADQDPKRSDYFFGNLTEDRVLFSIGRDLQLMPKQAGPDLNFFVYPYVEVDGRPHAKRKIRLDFSYQDVK